MKLWFLLSVPFMMYLIIFLSPVHAQNYNEQVAEKLIDESEGQDQSNLLTGMLSGKQTGGLIAMILGIISMVVALIGVHGLGAIEQFASCEIGSTAVMGVTSGACAVFFIIAIVLFIVGLMMMLMGKEKKSGKDKKNKFEMIGMLMEQLKSQANQNVAPKQRQTQQ